MEWAALHHSVVLQVVAAIVLLLEFPAVAAVVAVRDLRLAAEEEDVNFLKSEHGFNAALLDVM